MPRRNPGSYPTELREIVKLLSELTGPDIVRKVIPFETPQAARRIRYMAYALLTALEDWTKHGPEVLRANRVMAQRFKENYGIRQEGSTLVFVPKSEPLEGAIGLRAFLNETRQAVMSQPAGPLDMQPDVGVPQTKVADDVQDTLLHMRLQTNEQSEDAMTKALAMLGFSGENVATPGAAAPQLGLDNATEGPKMESVAQSSAPPAADAAQRDKEGSQ